MQKLDPFTERRLIRFIEQFRGQSGQLPILKDLREGGFPEGVIDLALKKKVIEQFYVTLSNGSILKAFKVSSPF